MRCFQCKKQIKEDVLCRECFGSLYNENLSLTFQLAELKKDKNPKQLSTIEILNYFEKLDKKIDNLELYIKNKKQFSTEKSKNRVTKKERDFILRRDDYTCQNCRKKFDRKLLQIDHIIPVSKGGTKDPSNLRVLCMECNMIKSSHEFETKKEKE